MASAEVLSGFVEVCRCRHDETDHEANRFPKPRPCTLCLCMSYQFHDLREDES